MLLQGSGCVLRSGSGGFLRRTSLGGAAFYHGPFWGGGSGSKFAVSGMGQTLSVRRVIYIQCYRLSVKLDG